MRSTPRWMVPVFVLIAVLALLLPSLNPEGTRRASAISLCGDAARAANVTYIGDAPTRQPDGTWVWAGTQRGEAVTCIYRDGDISATIR